jgi:hypothetical protein
MSERKPLVLMTQEQAEAFARLVEAAERGDGAAACRLGDMYREAKGGLRYSPKNAFRWYARSAMAGDDDGQNNLGACYEHGIGCAQSYPNAVKWYRRSVAQGVSTAYMNLGYCYLRGHGVPRDEVEALKLFREAVERGEERAAQEVERLEETPGLRRLQPVPSKRCSGGSRPEHSPADTQVDAPLPAVAAPPQPFNVRWIRRVRVVDETQPGTHLGLVGISGVQPPSPFEGDVATGHPADELRGSLGGGVALADRLEAGRRKRGYMDVLAPCPREQAAAPRELAPGASDGGIVDGNAKRIDAEPRTDREAKE